MKSARNKNASERMTNSNAGNDRSAAAKQAVDRAKQVERAARLLERQLQRCSRMQRRLHAEFGARIFLPHEPPTSRRNQLRFKTYLEMMNSVTMLKIKLLRELMRLRGFDPNNPEEMWRIAEIAAEILAKPASVGVASPQNSYQQPTTSSGPIKHR
jgi:hypothetical protein